MAETSWDERTERFLGECKAWSEGNVATASGCGCAKVGVSAMVRRKRLVLTCKGCRRVLAAAKLRPAKRKRAATGEQRAEAAAEPPKRTEALQKPSVPQKKERANALRRLARLHSPPSSEQPSSFRSFLTSLKK